MKRRNTDECGAEFHYSSGRCVGVTISNKLTRETVPYFMERVFSENIRENFFMRFHPESEIDTCGIAVVFKIAKEILRGNICVNYEPGSQVEGRFYAYFGEEVLSNSYKSDAAVA